MQTTEGLHCGCNEISHLLRIAHVGLYKNCFAFFSLNRLHRLRTCRIDVADYNFCEVSGKENGRSATNAAAPACDQHNLSSKIEYRCSHARSPCFRNSRSLCSRHSGKLPEVI